MNRVEGHVERSVVERGHGGVGHVTVLFVEVVMKMGNERSGGVMLGDRGRPPPIDERVRRRQVGAEHVGDAGERHAGTSQRRDQHRVAQLGLVIEAVPSHRVDVGWHEQAALVVQPECARREARSFRHLADRPHALVHAATVSDDAG